MTDYYFDGDNGNDSNDGLTSSTPRKVIKPSTIGGVFNPSNLRLFIKRGTNVLMDVSTIHPQGPFYIGPYGDGTAKPTVTYNANGDYYFATGSGATSTDQIVFDSVRLVDTTTTTLASGVYQNNSGSGQVIVKDCEIVGFLSGIMTQRGTGHQFLRNTITQWRNCGIITEHASVAAPSNMLISDNYVDSRGPTGTGNNDAIVLHAGTSNGTGNIVRRNVCVSGQEQAIDVLEMYPGTIIEDNVTYSRPDVVATLWSEIFCRGAGSIIRNNLVFYRNRIVCDLDGANITVQGNSFIGEAGHVGSQIVRCYTFTGAHNPTIVNNYFLMKSGFGGSCVLPNSGITTGTVKNNLMVNYSANTTARFVAAQVLSDLYTWSINYNYYVQMPGSHSTPWAGNRTLAQWQALTGTPDLNAITATSNPLIEPGYTNYGDRIDPKTMYQLMQSNPLIGAGQHTGYRRAAVGQFYNPPTIGPAEYVRARSARV